MQFAEWNPSGSRFACWCSSPAAIHVFECETYTPSTMVPFTGFGQLTGGLVYGLRDLLHMSLAQTEVETEAVSLCRLHAHARDDVSPPDPFPCNMSTLRAGTFLNTQPALPTALPAISPDGAFVAVVDRAVLHVLHSGSRESVFSHPLELPPDVDSHGRNNVVCYTAQLIWVPGRNIVMVVTAFEARAQAFLYHLHFFHF